MLDALIALVQRGKELGVERSYLACLLAEDFPIQRGVCRHLVHLMSPISGRVNRQPVLFDVRWIHYPISRE